MLDRFFLLKDLERQAEMCASGCLLGGGWLKLV